MWHRLLCHSLVRPKLNSAIIKFPLNSLKNVDNYFQVYTCAVIQARHKAWVRLKVFCGLSCCACIKLLLRCTLVRQQFYSTSSTNNSPKL